FCADYRRALYGSSQLRLGLKSRSVTGMPLVTLSLKPANPFALRDALLDLPSSRFQEGDSSCQFGQIFGILCHMNTTTLPFKHLISRTPRRFAMLLITLLLACFALSPQARADCREGCDTNLGNTFLGEDALLNDFGVGNTAVGAHALINNNTTGEAN